MDQLNRLKQFLQREEIPFLEEEPLKKHTSFQIGGPAQVFCMPVSEDQLIKVLNFCHSDRQKFFLLGNGTNVLFCDEGYDGAVICTRGLQGEILVEGMRMMAGCGTPLNALCRKAQEKGLGGLEFAYGIPGSLGGALYMNAGAYGGEMKDVVEQAMVLDEKGNLFKVNQAEMNLGYRTSIFAQNPWQILQVSVMLHSASPSAIQQRMEELLARRKEKQPLEYPSAGSTFKRPVGAFAAALIEECGLKGYRVGDAAVSEKHSGFVVNMGEATCEQVLQVARDVRRIVQEKTGYCLEEEIRVVRG